VACRKNSPGKPCCGCEGCCISHIKINVAKPNDPANGTGWIIEWDVSSQPAITKALEYVDGVLEEVCTQLFYAPTYTLCFGTITGVNAEFNVTHREIDATGRYVPSGGGGAGSDFSGFEVWRHNIMVQNLVVRVKRTTTKSRVIIQSAGKSEYTKYPKSGSSLIVFDAACTTTATINYTVEQPWGWCREYDTNPPGTQVLFPGYTVSGEEALGFTVSLDTGWIGGYTSCASLPVSSASSIIFGEYWYNPGSSGTAGRIPLSKTREIYVPTSACSPGDGWAYTYGTAVSYFAKNSVEFTLC